MPASKRPTPMYTPAQRMRYERCQCDDTGVTPPKQWLLDKIADDTAAGASTVKRAGVTYRSPGFNVRRSNICEYCHQTRSANGRCGCNWI